MSIFRDREKSLPQGGIFVTKTTVARLFGEKFEADLKDGRRYLPLTLDEIDYYC
jgi:hypothetical protein